MTTRAYVFCDVDGVLNARDRVRNTKGKAHDFDASLHYEMDGEKVFDGHDWTFYYSTEMIREFRDMIVNSDVEFVWVTNWREYAEIRLNPLFGFGTDVKHAPIRFSREDTNQSYKGEAIHEFLLENPEAKGRPFVWLDDVATLHYLSGGTHDGHFDQFDVEYRIFAPEERHGVTREQMRELKEFVQRFSPNQAISS